MLGVYIHNLKDSNSKVDVQGANPFSNWQVDNGGTKTLFSQLYPTYDWVANDGRSNLGSWIESAAKKAGR